MEKINKILLMILFQIKSDLYPMLYLNTNLLSYKKLDFNVNIYVASSFIQGGITSSFNIKKYANFIFGIAIKKKYNQNQKFLNKISFIAGLEYPINNQYKLNIIGQFSNRFFILIGISKNINKLFDAGIALTDYNKTGNEIGGNKTGNQIGREIDNEIDNNGFKGKKQDSSNNNKKGFMQSTESSKAKETIKEGSSQQIQAHFLPKESKKMLKAMSPSTNQQKIIKKQNCDDNKQDDLTTNHSIKNSSQPVEKKTPQSKIPTDLVLLKQENSFSTREEQKNKDHNNKKIEPTIQNLQQFNCFTRKYNFKNYILAYTKDFAASKNTKETLKHPFIEAQTQPLGNEKKSIENINPISACENCSTEKPNQNLKTTNIVSSKPVPSAPKTASSRSNGMNKYNSCPDEIQTSRLSKSKNNSTNPLQPKASTPQRTSSTCNNYAAKCNSWSSKTQKSNLSKSKNNSTKPLQPKKNPPPKKPPSRCNNNVDRHNNLPPDVPKKKGCNINDQTPNCGSTQIIDNNKTIKKENKEKRQKTRQTCCF